MRFIEDLVSKPLDDIAQSSYVAEPLGPILEQHATNIETVRRVARVDGEVVVTDLLEEKVGGLNKFIVYYLHPEVRYSVTMLAVGNKLKLSVGSNPWSTVPRTHNIAAICEQYGGGGHPVVGAISAARETIWPRARRVADEVLARLQELSRQRFRPGSSGVRLRARRSRLWATWALRFSISQGGGLRPVSAACSAWCSSNVPGAQPSSKIVTSRRPRSPMRSGITAAPMPAPT